MPTWFPVLFLNSKVARLAEEAHPWYVFICNLTQSRGVAPKNKEETL